VTTIDTAGMPPIDAGCAADLNVCRKSVLDHYGDQYAPKLYTLIRLALERGGRADALRYLDLYERRFAQRRPAEAAAVARLRALAERR
jgi:hypothetical protein